MPIIFAIGDGSLDYTVRMRCARLLAAMYDFGKYLRGRQVYFFLSLSVVCKFCYLCFLNKRKLR
nr:hypothetical protein [uncultured Prevotella sp.]